MFNNLPGLIALAVFPAVASFIGKGRAVWNGRDIDAIDDTEKSKGGWERLKKVEERLRDEKGKEREKGPS